MKTIVEFVNLIRGRSLKQRDSSITWPRMMQNILVMFYSVFAGSVEVQFWKECLHCILTYNQLHWRNRSSRRWAGH